jgi:hypothetical protein
MGAEATVFRFETLPVPSERKKIKEGESALPNSSTTFLIDNNSADGQHCEHTVNHFGSPKWRPLLVL